MKNQAMEAAVTAFRTMGIPARKPEDSLLITLKRLHQMNLNTLKAADLAEVEAHRAKLIALKAVAETEVLVELRQQAIGIEFACPDCGDAVKDEGDRCPSCAAAKADYLEGA